MTDTYLSALAAGLWVALAASIAALVLVLP